MELTDATYTAWKNSIFGSAYDRWHDGLYVEATKSYVGEQREHAIRMLIYGVQHGDGDAASVLAEMGETGAIADIRTALEQARGGNKVRFASALNVLSPGDGNSEAMAAKLVEVLEYPGDYSSTQMSAAIGLRNFHDAASEDALLRAVENNEDYLVRYHASESLLQRWGTQPGYIGSHRQIFSLISGQVNGEDQRSQRLQASALLKSLKPIRVGQDE